MRTEQVFDLLVCVLDDVSEFEVAKENSKIDIISIQDPDKNVISEMCSKGFFYGPQKIKYVINSFESEEDYMSSLSKNKRKKITKSIREIKKENISIVYEAPLSQESFLKWFKLYSKSMDDKDRGTLKLNEEWFLKNKDVALGFFAKKDEKIIGGILVKKVLDKNILRICFSAFDRNYSKLGIMDILNMKILSMSGELGFPLVDRGKDTNRYGHHLSSGLLRFKKALGFNVNPVEEQGNYLFYFNNFDKFDDMIIFFTYGDDNKSLLKENFILKRNDIDIFEFVFEDCSLDVYRYESGGLIKDENKKKF